MQNGQNPLKQRRRKKKRRAGGRPKNVHLDDACTNEIEELRKSYEEAVQKDQSILTQ